jgi:hypothetical protein
MTDPTTPPAPHPGPDPTEEFVGRIDWRLLRQQKRWLLAQAETSEEAQGLLHMLDDLMDLAVDRLGYAAAAVLGSATGAASLPGTAARTAPSSARGVASPRGASTA